MIKLLTFILLGLLTAFITDKAIKHYQKKKISLIIISMIHGAILTVLLLVFFNLPMLVLDQGMSLLSWTESIDQKIFPKKSEKAYQFIKDYFVLVDNSNDKIIAPDPDADPETKRGIVITDRNKINLLMKLAADSTELIDLMVCDITFNTVTTDDSLLRENMSKVITTNRLLLADDLGNKENDLLRFDPSVYGVVRENVDDQTFTVHTISQNDRLSLPFKLYNVIHKGERQSTFLNNLFVNSENANGKRQLFYNRFIPSFRMTDESLFKNNPPAFTATSVDTVTTSSYHYAKLGDVTTKFGMIDFIDNLIARKKEGQKNIIFIGSFETENEDIHNTAYGRLHGATILLNVVYALHVGQHQVDGLTIFLNFIFLTFITIGVFFKIEKKLRCQERFLKTFFDLLSNGIAFAIIMSAGIVSQWITGQNLNMVSLIVYFIAFYKFLKELQKRYVYEIKTFYETKNITSIFISDSYRWV